MLISYKTYKGSATRTSVVASDVGVMMPATTSMTTTECLLYVRMNEGVSIPILVKKYTRIGSSKIIPEIKVMVVTVEINESSEMVFFTSVLT